MASFSNFYKARGILIESRQYFPVVYPIVFWPLFAIYIVYYTVSMFLFYFFAVKRNDRSLIERSLYLTSLETGFALLFGINAFLRTALPLYPCFLDIWIVYIGHIAWSSVVTLIMLRYYLLAKSHQKLAAGIRQVPVTPSNLNQYLEKILTICKGNVCQHANNVNSGSCPQSKESSSTESVTGAVNQEQDGSTRGCLDSTIQSQAPAIVNVSRQRSIYSIQEIAPFADISSSTFYANRPQDPSIFDQPAVINIEPEQMQQNTTPYRQQNQQKRYKRLRSCLKGFNRVNALRRLKSKRFIASVIAAELAVVIVYLVFANIFSRQMSLRRIEFNCSRGWEYYVAMSTSLLFCLVICPVFLFVTWRLKDEYGIRASLAVSSIAGTLSWIGGIVWRTVNPPARYYISTSLFFLFQAISVHTCIVAYPVVKSIIFAKKQRAGMQDTERVRENGRVWTLDVPQTPYDLSKQSFLRALRDAAEHEKIQKFAIACFCGELVSFLDVYIALKRSIYQEIRQNGFNTQYSVPLLSAAGKKSLSLPCRSSNASFDKQTPLPFPSYRSQNQTSIAAGNSVQLDRNDDLEGSNETAHVSLRKRLSIMLSSTFSRKSASDLEQEYSVNHIADTEELQDLCSLSVGITQAMQQAFPELPICESTVLPQSLRYTVSTIIKTFMLPDSPLAINAPSNIVATCKAYLNGGQVTFGMLDQAKDEVIDMLYSNVYLRYRK